MKTRSIVTMTGLFLSLCLLTYGSASSALNRPHQFSKLTIVGGGPTIVDSVAPSDPERAVTTFVGIENGHFVLNGRLRFMGTNNYYLHYEPKPMVDDVIEDAAKMNLTVLRCWGFLDGQPKNGIVLQSEPEVYDENGFEKLDYVIAKAKEEGIRLVIVLTNNWRDFGGMNQYVEWVKNETGAQLLHDDFYTDGRCKQIYKDYVTYMLN